MDLKTAMNMSQHGHFSTSGQFLLGDWSNTILCIHFFLSTFFLLSPQLSEHSDLHCASQSLVDSSFNKIFALLPGYQRFCVGIIVHPLLAAFLHDANRKGQMVFSSHDCENFELHLLWIFPCNSYSVPLAWRGFLRCHWDWDTDTQ